MDSMDVHLSEGGLTTADKVHKREEFRLLIADVQDLPETQRTALLLREIDALSYEQIAEAMETTVPSVKSLLVRARVSLAEAAEARLLSCDEVRLELGEVAEGLTRTSAPVRRHLRTCERCADVPQAPAHEQQARSPPCSRSGRCCCSRSCCSRTSARPPPPSAAPARPAPPPARPARARRCRSASAPSRPRPARASPPPRSSPPAPSRSSTPPSRAPSARRRSVAQAKPVQTAARRAPHRRSRGRPRASPRRAAGRRRTSAARARSSHARDRAQDRRRRRRRRPRRRAPPRPSTVDARPPTPAGRGPRRRHDRAADRHAGHRPARQRHLHAAAAPRHRPDAAAAAPQRRRPTQPTPAAPTAPEQTATPAAPPAPTPVADPGRRTPTPTPTPTVPRQRRQPPPVATAARRRRRAQWIRAPSGTSVSGASRITRPCSSEAPSDEHLGAHRADLARREVHDGHDQPALELLAGVVGDLGRASAWCRAPRRSRSSASRRACAPPGSPRRRRSGRRACRRRRTGRSRSSRLPPCRSGRSGTASSAARWCRRRAPCRRPPSGVASISSFTPVRAPGTGSRQQHQPAVEARAAAHAERERVAGGVVDARLALLDRLELGEALLERVQLARGDDRQDAADVALVGGQLERLDDERVEPGRSRRSSSPAAGPGAGTDPGSAG